MKEMNAFLLFGIFLIFLLPPVLSQVYINEVELNPPGEPDIIDEWVELYNSGDAVDISGWKVYDKGGPIFPILASTTINKKGFYVFNISDSDKLDNGGDAIILKDSLDVLIDSTPNPVPIYFTDVFNDEKTWQRIADGTGDFKFREQTRNSSNHNGVINVPADYSKIQDAIDNAGEGDVVNVSAGVYDEDLVIDKSIELIGSPGNSPGPGPNAPILDGGGVVGSAITIAGGLSNITIQGFEIRNYRNRLFGTPWTTGGIGSGILAWNSVGTSNIKILDNYFHDLGWNAVLVGNEGQSLNNDWLVEGNIAEDWAAYGIELTNTKNSNVIGNLMSGGENILAESDDDSQDGILIQSQVHTGSGLIVENVTVFNNIINSTFKRAGVEVLAWDSTNSLTSKLKDINIINNNISEAERGVYIFSVGANADIDNLNINENIINGNSDGIQIKTISGGAHGPINIERNDIINSIGIDSGIRIMLGTSTSEVGVHFNNIINNLLYGINNKGTGNLNATHNYWGSCTGPYHSTENPLGTGDAVSANVDFTPWLGACIDEKIEEPENCIFENENVKLYANISSDVCIGEVVFSVLINGIWQNFTGTKTTAPSPGNYTAEIGGLNSGLITWTVYAEDCYNHTEKDGEKNFSVYERTSLNINATNPDGMNDWYVTEPLFSLIPDSNKENSSYQWDSTGPILYLGDFGLENIPNPPSESAGILELNWWSEFAGSCTEEIQNQTFHIDLTDPVIKNLVPANNSIVYTPRPFIEAYLDEVYGSNSGINKVSVIMKIDGVIKNADVVDAGSIDAIVQYKPTSDLSNGLYEIYVYAEDNAGRSSELNWTFEIGSIEGLNLDVSSPKEKIYSTKKINFGVVTNHLSEIEYINWNDKKPRWKRLCRSCDEYDKPKTFNEGENNITIRAKDKYWQTNETNISFFIDSKAPKISRTLPRRNQAVNGSEFYIKYTEDNLKNITLFYGLGTEEETKYDCESGKNKECIFRDVDLISFKDRYIEYWFMVYDSVNNAESRKTRVFVDTTSPELTVNFPENKTYERKVRFNMTVTEDVTLEYKDYSDTNPRWKTLCSRCDEYGTDREKTKSFKRGSHYLIIRAIDKAGNSDTEEINFEVDY